MKVKVYQVFATESEAIIFMEEYLREYHPYGYSTSLRIEEDKDTWVVRGYRYNSCD